jgi:hypothetical protein
MRTVKSLWAILLFSVACVAATPPSSTDDANRIIQVALQPSALESNLHHLTDEIGGRVPGTQAMQHAVEWGVKAFNVAGADSVHSEGFTIPNSWAEGATEMTVTAFYEVGDPKVGGLLPTIFRAHAVSIAWAPALAPSKHIPIVDVGTGSESDFSKAGDISGKVVLVHTAVLKTWADLFAEYTNAPPAIDRAVKGKARAVAFIATREHDILYRHTNSSQGEID